MLLNLLFNGFTFYFITKFVKNFINKDGGRMVVVKIDDETYIECFIPEVNTDQIEKLY